MSQRDEEPEYEHFSWLAGPKRRTAGRTDRVRENIRREICLLEDNLADLHVYRRRTWVENLVLGANTSFQEKSDVEKEQMRRELRAAKEKAERQEAKLQTLRDLLSEESVDREFQISYMSRRIEELHDMKARAWKVLAQQNLSDDSEPEDDDAEDDTADEGDSTECASGYCTPPREFAESSFLPLPTSMSDGITDRQAEKCPICLCEFVTQEIAVPEGCDHVFCADCLQEWLKNVSTCPIDRQVCDTILVCNRQVGEVKRVHVETQRQQAEEYIYYIRCCEVCGESDHLEDFIDCCRCGQAYHRNCVRPSSVIPEEEWFCRDCVLPSPSNDESEEE